METDGIGIRGSTRIHSFPETGSSLVLSDGAFTRPGVLFKLLFMATVAAIAISVRVTVRATPRPVRRAQLATRLVFAAVLSEAAPLAVEGFGEAEPADSAARAVGDFTEAAATAVKRN